MIFGSNMQKDVCVDILTHLDKLSGDDEKSFLRALKIFTKRDIKLVLPNSVNKSYYEQFKEDVEIVCVNDEWMSSYKNYNRMCCNKDFYNLFSDYDYILIYQTDCWVFEDRLDFFMDFDCDYYGAPCPHVSNKLFNGGFSLRKVSKMIELCEKYKNSIHDHFEDQFFCFRHKNEIKICDLKTASNFSVETWPHMLYQYIDEIPMGLHGTFCKIYWDETGEKFKYDKENNIKR